MDAAELSRWTRFAGKGGIGKGTAVQDCVAKNPEDLMFLRVSRIKAIEPSLFFYGYLPNLFKYPCEAIVHKCRACRDMKF